MIRSLGKSLISGIYMFGYHVRRQTTSWKCVCQMCQITRLCSSVKKKSFQGLCCFFYVVVTLVVIYNLGLKQLNHMSHLFTKKL